MQPFGGQRRVPGLRREEAAYLSGVSVDYFTRFERGRLQGVSDDVVDAVASALRLDGDEREHLHNLIASTRGTSATPRARAARTARSKGVPAGVQAVVDALAVPAFVENARLDVVATNHLGRALYPFMSSSSNVGVGVGEPYNHARFLFLDDRARDFFRDYDRAARNVVAHLRAAAGRDPFEPGLVNLIGQLSTQSMLFRELWGGHEVVQFRSGSKRYHHPLVGDIDFTYETLVMPMHAGLTLMVYTVARSSRTDEAMKLLASWTAEPMESSETIGEVENTKLC